MDAQLSGNSAPIMLPDTDDGPIVGSVYNSVAHESTRSSVGQFALHNRLADNEKETVKVSRDTERAFRITDERLEHVERRLSDKIEGAERRSLERQLEDKRHSELLTAILSIKA